MNRRTLVVLFGALLLTTGAALGAAGFDTSIPGSIDTPEKTVQIEGSSYTISSVARVEKGETLSVETTAPDDEEYRVYVHGIKDGSQKVQDRKFVTPDDDRSVTFETGEFTPGSYSVSIYDADTGEYYSPHPVVVPAFETNLAIQNTVTEDQAFNASVSTTQIESGSSISGVELVFAQGDTTKRVDAPKSNGTYTASVSLSKTGDWDVYGAVKGEEDALQGEKELIGISDPTQIEVSDDTPTTTPTATPTTSSNQGGGGSVDTEPAQSETTTTTTQVENTTQGRVPTVTTSPDLEPTTGSTTNTASQSTQDNKTDTTQTTTSSTSGVIEPNTDSPDDSSNGVAGGIPLILLALLATAGLVLREL
ncbi:hypothetical protein PNQ29_06675 [Halobacterium salinarum]|uniref:hypothetical protein n=1 Tax=Halobacterium salinarum TaxID=2242 RepID=UPI00255607EA|nr:hypothetical protein [Halobacterium salinarum]MDL0119413.1 hypothetical protein [Halobacterium salinarum]MDL0128285.1 hypothetical protein [Halobacterium salinarum]